MMKYRGTHRILFGTNLQQPELSPFKNLLYDSTNWTWSPPRTNLTWNSDDLVNFNSNLWKSLQSRCFVSNPTQGVWLTADSLKKTWAAEYNITRCFLCSYHLPMVFQSINLRSAALSCLNHNVSFFKEVWKNVQKQLVHLINCLWRGAKKA